jgi:phage shock protein PspC (stress-responsive transcriptional regulator)
MSDSGSNPTLTAIIIVAVLIVSWLIFLAVDAYFGLFIFAPYEPPPLENAFQPTKNNAG